MGIIGTALLGLCMMEKIRFWRILLAGSICAPIVLLIYFTFSFGFYPEMYILAGAATGLLFGGILMNRQAAGLCLIFSVLGTVFGGLIDDGISNSGWLPAVSGRILGIIDWPLLKTSLFALVWGAGIGLGIGLSSLMNQRKIPKRKTIKISTFFLIGLILMISTFQSRSFWLPFPPANDLNMILEAEQNDVRTEAMLTELMVNGMSVPGFDPQVFFYDLGIVSCAETTLCVSATAKDDQAEVIGTGTFPFEAGNIYRYPISVHLANSSTNQTYVIRIQRSVKSHKKAIYILPGIMDSEILSEKGMLLWPKANIYSRAADHLYCEADGRSEYAVIAADPIPDDDRYGALNFFHPMIHQLQRSFSSDYDILFFPYDWRLDARIASQKLNLHITLGNYESVVLVGYSLGGLVATNYAANHLNDTKIEHLIAVATPFLGSPKVALTYMTGETLKVPFLSVYLNKSYYLSSSRNMLSGYQLLPHMAYFQYQSHYLSVAASNETAFSQQQNIQSDEASLDFLKEKFGIKDMAFECRDFQESFYQNGDHLVKFMAEHQGNASVIVGTKIPTITSFLIAEHNGNIDVNPIKSLQGDGTIPSLSASIGGSIPSRNTYYIEKVNHTALLSDKRILKVITNIISGAPDTLPDGITHECPSKLELIK